MTPPRPLTFACLLLTAATAFAQPRGPRVAATTLKMPAEGNTYAYKTMPAFGGIFVASYDDHSPALRILPNDITLVFS